MVASDPGPAASSCKAADRRAFLRRQQGGGVLVVEAIAEADDLIGSVPRNDPLQRGQGGTAIIRGYEAAAWCIAGTLFQMQIGNDDKAARRPDERAGRGGEECATVDG